VARPVDLPGGLIPYVDLLDRLSPHELGRLGGIDPRIVHAVQTRLRELSPRLDRFRDNVENMRIDDLVRASGLGVPDVAFWMRCRLPTSSTRAS
jgi:hypothetical protein